MGKNVNKCHIGGERMDAGNADNFLNKGSDLFSESIFFFILFGLFFCLYIHIKLQSVFFMFDLPSLVPFVNGDSLIYINF